MQELIVNIAQLLDPEYLTTQVVSWIPRVFAAILVFLVFWVLTRITRPALGSALHRARFDEALVKLLVDQLYRFTLLILGLLMAVSQLGVDVGAALAGLGVAGFAVGFAAQDSIANTIAGILIFWDRPFEVGHMVQTQDQYGKVAAITMRTTRIRTPDNTYVVIPNRKIIEDVLVNHSMYGESRVRIPVGIAYKEDVEAARKVLLEAVAGVGGVAEQPAPVVTVTELGDSSVTLECRVWVMSAEEERPVHFRVLETAKRALDDAGIEIPFPHLQLFLDDVEDRVWERVERVPALSAGPGRTANGGGEPEPGGKPGVDA